MGKEARISFAYDEEDKIFLQKEAKKDNRKLSSLIQIILKDWIYNKKLEIDQSKKRKTYVVSS